MAIYHLSVKPVQRSKGRSAPAAAAYRAGVRLRDARTDEVHDYRRRRGVAHAELFGWAGSREALWSAAELAERRRDATVAREYEVALPVDLAPQARIELARQFAQYLQQRYRCAVDLAVHDLDSHNPHAHILTTTREVIEDGHGLGDKIAREWSDARRKKAGLPGRKAELEHIRRQWAQGVNQALEAYGVDARVDHRSLEAQGIERLPQPKLGPAAAAMERRGVRTERGDELRRVQQVNAEIEQINAGIRQVAAEVHELQQAAEDRAREGERLRGLCDRFDLDLRRLQPAQAMELLRLDQAQREAEAWISRAEASLDTHEPGLRDELRAQQARASELLEELQEARETVELGRRTLAEWRARSAIARGLDALGAAILRQPTEEQRLTGLLAQAEAWHAEAQEKHRQAAAEVAATQQRIEGLYRGLETARQALERASDRMQQYAREVRMDQNAQLVDLARSAAATWRAEQAEAHRQTDGVVYVSAEGEVSGWRRHGLGDPAGLAPGSLAVDALGQVWEASGGDPHHGARQWVQIAAPDPGLNPDPDPDPDYGEDYSGPSFRPY